MSILVKGNHHYDLSKWHNDTYRAQYRHRFIFSRYLGFTDLWYKVKLPHLEISQFLFHDAGVFMPPNKNHQQRAAVVCLENGMLRSDPGISSVVSLISIRLEFIAS